MTSRGAWLRDLEHSLAEDQSGNELATALVVLASVAGQGVQIGEDEEHGASRRALLLLTAGGDPDRGLDLNGRAVTALAEEVRTVDRQLALERGLDELKAEAKGLAHVSEALTALRATPDVAWRAYACSCSPRSSAASYLPCGRRPGRRPLVALLDPLQLFLCAHSDGALEPVASRQDPPAAEERGRCPRTRGSCSC